MEGFRLESVYNSVYRTGKSCDCAVVYVMLSAVGKHLFSDSRQTMTEFSGIPAYTPKKEMENEW